MANRFFPGVTHGSTPRCSYRATPPGLGSPPGPAPGRATCWGLSQTSSPRCGSGLPLVAGLRILAARPWATVHHSAALSHGTPFSRGDSLRSHCPTVALYHYTLSGERARTTVPAWGPHLGGVWGSFSRQWPWLCEDHGARESGADSSWSPPWPAESLSRPCWPPVLAARADRPC